MIKCRDKLVIFVEQQRRTVVQADRAARHVVKLGYLNTYVGRFGYTLPCVNQ